MRRGWVCACVAMLAMAASPGLYGATPLGTGFTYQGRLVDDGVPYDGAINIEFRLYDAADVQIGSPSVHNDVLVTRGLFTVSDVNGAGQFGAAAFNGEARKLGITVNGAAMSPVPFCTAVPYALYALSSGGGSGGSCLWTASGSNIHNSNPGSVGIGTTSPVGRLTVGGGDLYVEDYNSIPIITARRAGGTYAAPTAVTSGQVIGRFSAGGYDGSAFSAGEAYVSMTAAETWTAAAHGAYLNFSTTPTGSTVPVNRMWIMHDGKVGIGTASPAASLHVSGGNAVVDSNLGLGTTAPAARLHVVDNAVVTGSVGIGTTSPDFRLHVQGSGSAEVAAAIHNTNTAGFQSLYLGASTATDAAIVAWGSTHASYPGKVRFINNRTSANYDWLSNGNVRMTLDNSGNLGVSTGNLTVAAGSVGIGTTSPAFKLHVEGSTTGEVAAAIHNLNNTGSEALYFGTSTASDAAIQVSGSTNATTPGKWRFLNNRTSANYDWVTNSTVRMTLDNSGNLGIGTASPAARLHVSGGAIVTGDLGVGTTSPAARLHVAGGNAVVDQRLGIGTSSPGASLHVADGDMILDDYASPACFYGRRANGTLASPSAVAASDSLTMVGAAGYDGSTFATEAYMEFLSAEAWTTAAHGTLIRFVTSPNGTTLSYERMRIADDGKIGIGTATPEVMLNVNGGTDASLTGGGYVELGTVSGANLVVDNNEIMTRNAGAASPLYLNQDGGDVLISGLGTGNVGIGTNSPGGRLHVITDTQQYGVRVRNTGEGGIALFAYGGPSGYAADFRGNVRIWDYATNDLVIELGTGLDYAEGFDVADPAAAPAGTVLVIDPEAEGQLKVSHRSYDTCVAGIVAGAKGLGSGVRLGCGQYDRDVALAGRVYCNVDATAAGVEAGDLLTTSDTPGYAMKASNRQKAQGAILGKAMQRLEKGRKAQILVLVTLQ